MSNLFKEELHRLSPIGKAYINDEFLNNSEGQLITDADAWRPIDVSIKVQRIQPLVDDVIENSDVSPSETDGKLAEGLHKSISLPRRYAVDSAVWHYLTCLSYPEYVRYRWTRNNGFVSKERFLGGIKRNAFARLWWAAELLHVEDDYSLVYDCFSNQDLYEAVFGRSLSKYQPAARLAVEMLKNKPRSIFREAIKRLNMLLSTYLLEDLDRTTLTRLINEQLEIIESET